MTDIAAFHCEANADFSEAKDAMPQRAFLLVLRMKDAASDDMGCEVFENELLIPVVELWQVDDSSVLGQVPSLPQPTNVHLAIIRLPSTIQVLARRGQEDVPGYQVRGGEDDCFGCPLRAEIVPKDTEGCGRDWGGDVDCLACG